MHLKCVCLCICARGLCVSCWKDVFSLWSSLLCAPCESGVAKKGAPHPHYQALCTVSLIKRLLYLGPASLNCPRFALAGKNISSCCWKLLAPEDAVKRSQGLKRRGVREGQPGLPPNKFVAAPSPSNWGGKKLKKKKKITKKPHQNQNRRIM